MRTVRAAHGITRLFRARRDDSVRTHISKAGFPGRSARAGRRTAHKDG